MTGVSTAGTGIRQRERMLNRSHTRRRDIGRVIVAGMLAAALGATGSASAHDDATQAGAEQFYLHCGVCHGIAARGDGPLAALMHRRPPDLTGLARAHDGEFPFQAVYEVVDGRRPLAGHGDRDMPVWGKLFERQGSGAWSETIVRGRILEILIYLRSVQR
ncbi:MAG: cytochrome c [Gammaproteobacteria bacterium]|nr:cytochrome c [Gammaproteobacteria bacterium]